MNLRNISAVARFEFTNTMQRRSALLIIFGLPLLTIAVLWGLNRIVGSQTEGDGNASNILSEFATGGEQAVQVGVVDNSGVIDFSLLAEVSGYLPFESSESAQAAFDSGEINGFYVVPADVIETGTIMFHVERVTPNGAGTQPIYRALATSLIEDGEFLAHFLAPIEIQETDLSASETRDTSNFGAAYATGIAVAILFYLTAMSASGYLLQSLGKEKQNRIMEILLSSLRPLELLSGKVLGLGAVGLLQMVIWLALGIFLSSQSEMLGNLALPELSVSVWLAIMAFFIVGFLSYACLFAGLGAMAPSTKESGQYTFFMMLPTFVPLWFMTIILQSPNGGFAVATSMIPLTSPIAMPVRMILTEVPFWQIGSSILVGLGLATVALWLATRVFHSQTLLSGSDLSLRTLRTALFG